MSEYMNNNMDQGMDWNDTIESDGREFIILPEGDYNFTVTGFERGRFPGSAKMQACNKASLTLQVNTSGGVAICHTDLILNRLLEWKISSFFRCIGQKKHGERLVMDWNRVIGSRGRAHFKPRTYTSNGEERQANDVDKFYDWDDKNFPAEDDWMTISGDDDELSFE